MNVSSRNPPYDSTESRRSPRDRSPGRYNDPRPSDQYRGGGNRGGSERRRSIEDLRIHHNNPLSNRDAFRDLSNRDNPRDFPPREPPRGPKALIDIPSGPRANSYSGDFRADFSFRGDFRGRGGRGRGRGWRDESRDRGREPERDFRDRREERVGPPPFRDDRSRDRERWERDAFRGRRPSSPSGRGRSPSYGNRDRDVPPSVDIERTRRESRDGPLPIPSPSSDTLPFGRGHGRGRATPLRGRGRGFYDEFHRQPPGRSRSPEPSWNRRTQPSATPPPQVPAFGSTSSSTPVVPSGPSIPSTSASASVSVQGPVVGVPVPTAPRSQRLGRGHPGLPSSIQKVFTGNKEPIVSKAELKSPTKSNNPVTAPQAPAPVSVLRPTEGQSEQAQLLKQEESNKVTAPAEPKIPEPVSSGQPPSTEPLKKRRPTIGRRAPNVPARVREDSTDSDSDSGDDFDDDYFEKEILQVEARIREIEGGSRRKLEVPPDPADIIVQPFIQHAIDDIVAATISDEADSCPVPPQPWPTPTTWSGNNDKSSIAGATAATTRMPSTQTSQPSRNEHLKPGAIDEAEPQTHASRPTFEQYSASALDGQNIADQNGESTKWRALENDDHATNGALAIRPSSSNDRSVHANALANGQEVSPRASAAKLEQLDESDEEQTIAEFADYVEAVRKSMPTPPLSSLPNFNCSKWYEDQELLASSALNPVVVQRLRARRHARTIRRRREQDEERRRWKERYLRYRRWTDFSPDPAAVRSRENFTKSRAKAAAEAAAPRITAIAAAGSKPEGQRRAGSRFATEHDFERVLRESEQEARETKQREERDARVKTANAKEATLPDMCWDEEELNEEAFIDRTHLVPFERSFVRLEAAEPIDNFTEAEAQIFEETYMAFPKQWDVIAAALPGRDYKACIQHYYLVKGPSNLKEKGKKSTKKKRPTRQGAAKGGRPKSMTLTANLANRDDGDDGQDTENGGDRRRPRRAAAPVWPFEESRNDSDASTPVATPGRKAAATPKGDNGNDAAPSKKRAKVAREKGAKQSKNSQLLAAAPASANRLGDSPAPSVSNQEWKNRREPLSAPRYAPPQDGTTQLQPTFAPPYVPTERAPPAANVNFEMMSQHFANQDRLGSAPPSHFESQQSQRNMQPTSSYWSVPEVTDFPALLRHFGTNWHGIAKFMASKTHIMVYTTVFKPWLTVPSDSNNSRRVANIQTQVKNYYQRQVESGRMSSWEAIAREADEKLKRGESTGPLPTPTVIPKRRYDAAPGPVQRSGSVMDGFDEVTPPGQTAPIQQNSPPQPSLSSRFPALAQAGPVPQSLSQTVPPSAGLSKAPQQAPRLNQAQQQTQQQVRTPRGPSLGYFNTESQRPILQANSVHHAQSGPPASDSAISQRSLMAAQQAQLEQQQALRTIQEQQQQQAIQRERQTQQLKQESETANVHQYEPFPAPPKHMNLPPQTRPEHPQSLLQPDARRPAVPQQYQPHSHQLQRGNMVEPGNAEREMKATPATSGPRAPQSAPPSIMEQHPPPRPAFPNAPQPPSAPPVARQEPARKSNIMSLLNDEPSEPTPQQHKRLSDISSGLQTSRTPPQQPQQPSRPLSHPSQPTAQPPPQMQQKVMSHHQHQQHQNTQPQHQYSQPAAPPIHHHSSSVGASRSYTPTNFERGYGPPPPMQQQQQQQQQQATQQQVQQQHYSQAPRQSMPSQPPSIRREPSRDELHALSGGYSRTSAPSQSSLRLKESPYSATPPPPQLPSQAGRPHHGSPHDVPPASERDYYARAPPYMLHQQANSAGSPQLGPTYHPQSQQAQPQPSHRQLAFGQTPSRLASPPNQFSAQNSIHRSRQNSFDSRLPPASSAPLLSGAGQQGYVSAPHHPASSLGMQYQQQQNAGQDRLSASTYERELREREIREREHRERELRERELRERELRERELRERELRDREVRERELRERELRERDARTHEREMREIIERDMLERGHGARQRDFLREREMREQLREQEMRDRERRLQEEAYRQRRFEESRR